MQTGSNFSVSRQRVSNDGKLIRCYHCQFGQTPQWSNGNRAVPIARKGKCQIRGHVSRRHGCTAQIEVAMSLEYAVRIGIHTPQGGECAAMPSGGVSQTIFPERSILPLLNTFLLLTFHCTEKASSSDSAADEACVGGNASTEGEPPLSFVCVCLSV